MLVTTGWPINGTVFWYALTSPNINRFSKFFHYQNQKKTCNDAITPHLKCITTLSCEMSSVLKATIENKTTSVTTHFKESNNREQRVYCPIKYVDCRVPIPVSSCSKNVTTGTLKMVRF